MQRALCHSSHTCHHFLSVKSSFCLLCPSSLSILAINCSYASGAQTARFLPWCFTEAASKWAQKINRYKIHYLTCRRPVSGLWSQELGYIYKLKALFSRTGFNPQEISLVFDFFRKRRIPTPLSEDWCLHESEGRLHFSCFPYKSQVLQTLHIYPPPSMY